MEEERCYLNLDADGYLLSVFLSPEELDCPRVEAWDGIDISGARIGAWRWDGTGLVWDEEHWAQIEAAEREQTPAVTREDRLESQLYYTAMMTDTLLEV